MFAIINSGHDVFKYLDYLALIKSFGNAQTRDFWETGKAGKKIPANLRSTIMRKLLMLDAAAELDDLRLPPGNRLHPLTGDRAGRHAIRINDQYRLCFIWKSGNAFEVQIVDYH